MLAPHVSVRKQPRNPKPTHHSSKTRPYEPRATQPAEGLGDDPTATCCRRRLPHPRRCYPDRTSLRAASNAQWTARSSHPINPHGLLHSVHAPHPRSPRATHWPCIGLPRTKPRQGPPPTTPPQARRKPGHQPHAPAMTPTAWPQRPHQPGRGPRTQIVLLCVCSADHQPLAWRTTTPALSAANQHHQARPPCREIAPARPPRGCLLRRTPHGIVSPTVDILFFGTQGPIWQWRTQLGH